MKEDLYQQMHLQEKYYWWHIAKRRLVIDFIRKEKGLEVLDFGCGTGLLMKELIERGYHVFGVDNSSIALELCQKRGIKDTKKCNFEDRLTFEDKFFDVIICLDVLEHIENDINLLEEFRRI